MGDVGPVEGVAKKQCNMTIPYAVEGEKQSEVKILMLGKSNIMIVIMVSKITIPLKKECLVIFFQNTFHCIFATVFLNGRDLVCFWQQELHGVCNCK